MSGITGEESVVSSLQGQYYGLTGNADAKALFDPEKECGKRLKLTKDEAFVVIEQ